MDVFQLIESILPEEGCDIVRLRIVRQVALISDLASSKKSGVHDWSKKIIAPR
jgi:hypothetical protein